MSDQDRQSVLSIGPDGNLPVAEGDYVAQRLLDYKLINGILKMARDETSESPPSKRK